MSYFEDVVTWDNRTGLTENSDIDLRIKVVDEEAKELAIAMEQYMRAVDRGVFNDGASQEVVDLFQSAEVNVADGIADLIWTLLGLANCMDIPFDLIWEEVKDSNFSKIKFDGTVDRREDGKILKPDTYHPPRILEMIELHRDFGSERSQ